eukprot:TRINITY_DN437_c7_g1_i1.p1 TRINITY_DN437_c7_g1~~TRINITY_DN437_c7_g1_i1.p1  ORF type:complete len:209 (+),score=37.74 TRINITY_DN437_c7_g1_i1:70-696(+)
MDRPADIILQVDDVVVMEKGYKIFEGQLLVVVVKAVTDEEKKTVIEVNGEADSLVFGLCDHLKVPLNKTISVKRTGCNYHTELMKKELTFMLPVNLSEEQFAYVDATLDKYTCFTVSRGAEVCDRGACVGAPPATPPSPASPKAELSFLERARQAKAKLFKEDAPKDPKSGPTPQSPQKTSIPDSVAKSMFQLTSAAKGAMGAGKVSE